MGKEILSGKSNITFEKVVTTLGGAVTYHLLA